ncbi:hypothetical protein [Altererythrobacter sp. MTPC7]
MKINRFGHGRPAALAKLTMLTRPDPTQAIQTVENNPEIHD